MTKNVCILFFPCPHLSAGSVMFFSPCFLLCLYRLLLVIWPSRHGFVDFVLGGFPLLWFCCECHSRRLGHWFFVALVGC